MVSGGMTCVKYLLFCFNLIFAISGVAIFTVGMIIHTVYHHYSYFIEPSFESAPVVLIIVGVIVAVVAFFGCCGAVKENHCMIITFAALLLIIFTIELAAGLAGYARRMEVGDMLENQFNTSMQNYYVRKDVEKSWNILQHEMKCCGMNGPEDWRSVIHNETLPHTCCPDTQNDGTCTIMTLNKYTKSCLESLEDTLLTYSTIIGGVGCGVAVIQLIGVVFACCLACSIRKEYETV
ncbi:PREDICTED: CD63 antigen [Nicrophorus vespilloides]|uniref:Tetraspanin n=1 Tax=Nicrophorus vespilloides TaxID=110193 RepID=A0ABM1MU80_NICVS|nr:PREDICTED: CD63 antigen [Nicrophorus vespilloides]